jgi:hypothetical protein
MLNLYGSTINPVFRFQPISSSGNLLSRDAAGFIRVEGRNLVKVNTSNKWLLIAYLSLLKYCSQVNPDDDRFEFSSSKKVLRCS